MDSSIARVLRENTSSWDESGLRAGKLGNAMAGEKKSALDKERAAEVQQT